MVTRILIVAFSILLFSCSKRTSLTFKEAQKIFVMGIDDDAVRLKYGPPGIIRIAGEKKVWDYEPYDEIFFSRKPEMSGFSIFFIDGKTTVIKPIIITRGR